MKSKDLHPLKVSLHGMNERMQKLIINYLKLTCNGMAIVVKDDEAEAEIVDIDYPHSEFLLEDRLAQQPSKPIIVISLQEVTSKDFIFVKKPLEVDKFIHALSTVKDIIYNKTVLKKIVNANKIPNITKSETVKPPSVSAQSELKAAINFSKTSAASTPGSNKNKLLNKGLEPVTFVNKPDSKTVSRNNREEIRYVFKGLKGSLEIKSLVGIKNRLPIVILNISCKGALIKCSKPLKLGSKVALIIQFSPPQIFNISTRVRRKQENKSYGLVFEKRHHTLIDYLIESGGSFNIILTES